MSDQLSVDYMGLKLVSPVIVGACPLTIDPDRVRQFVAAGAGAIVLPSVLQEQVVYRLTKQTDPLKAIELSGYHPQQDRYNGGADEYLESIVALRPACPVPVIASLNGSSSGQWLDYATELESAGADALEINLQQAVFDPMESSNEVESRLCEILRRVQEHTRFPIAVKINQRFSNLASMVRQLIEAEASAIVLFGHRPHWDVSTDRMRWTVHWQLTPPDSLGGTLEGIVTARANHPSISIAASGGVAKADDAIKAMIAGANAVTVTSAVYRHGPDAIRQMIDGIEHYLQMKHFDDVTAFQAACPQNQPGNERSVRLEYVDPLTRSDLYYDPQTSRQKPESDAYQPREAGHSPYPEIPTAWEEGEGRRGVHG